jgi:aspartokinase
MAADELKGFTISSELVLINLVDLEDVFVSVLPLLQIIKQNRINIPFFSAACSDTEKPSVSACFAREDEPMVQALIQKEDRLWNRADTIHGVGLLAVYPHRSSLSFLGVSVSALRNAGLPIYGLSSSISSLIFVLPYSQLEQAVDALKNGFSCTGNGVH